MISLNLKHMNLNVELGDKVADPKLLNGGHPLHFVVKTKRSTEVYLDHVYDLLKDLPKGMNVVELFAGVGLFPKMLWDALEPKFWYAVELDPSCEEVYQEPRATFLLGSVFDPKMDFSKADLVIVDNPNNTLRKMREDKDLKPLFDRIFAGQPKYVEITDVEYWWIHLQNHWPHYKDDFALLGINERPDTATLRAKYEFFMEAHVRQTYGYNLVGTRVGGGAQYFLFQRGDL
jgi:hypothetical protein